LENIKKKTLIFTATYNEADNIKYFLDSVTNLNLEADLLIIDDNSPDQTWKIVDDYSKIKKFVNLIIRKKKEGLDTAHKLAYEYAIQKNYDFLITMDADLSHDPKSILNFSKELENNNFVIGSRYIKGGKCNLTGFRFFLSYFGNKFIKLILQINSNEFTTSYRGFNLKKLDGFSLSQVSSKGYSFFMETIYKIHSKGISIKEIPITFNHRLRGESKIPKIEIFRTLTNLLKLKILSLKK
tara:strand:- start:3399 stop:4118 length:720 start_codon:yes stop_codon:yes gene_type:complete